MDSVLKCKILYFNSKKVRFYCPICQPLTVRRKNVCVELELIQILCQVSQLKSPANCSNICVGKLCFCVNLWERQHFIPWRYTTPLWWTPSLRNNHPSPCPSRWRTCPATGAPSPRCTSRPSPSTRSGPPPDIRSRVRSRDTCLDHVAGCGGWGPGYSGQGWRVGRRLETFWWRTSFSNWHPSVGWSSVLIPEQSWRLLEAPFPIPKLPAPSENKGWYRKLSNVTNRYFIID